MALRHVKKSRLAVAVRPVTGYRSSEGQAKLPLDTASLPPNLGASRCPDALHQGAKGLVNLSKLQAAGHTSSQPGASQWTCPDDADKGGRLEVCKQVLGARKLQVRGAADPLHLWRHRRHNHHAAVLDVHLHLQLVLPRAAATQLCGTNNTPLAGHSSNSRKT